MDISNLLKDKSFKNLTESNILNKPVSGVYCCDLLSLVMANAKPDNIWITVHTHPNIVAVALLNELACIILPEGINPENSTLEKAKEEGIAILSSDLSAYELCCKLNEILL